eukprot:GHUV01037018.1.p1 GENE.GHUV01037018.1~~GHUV01037018.1.p1  ORF type:complete len:130 (-),score=39.01 GHUV01037018.1:452-841(-)
MLPCIVLLNLGCQPVLQAYRVTKDSAEVSQANLAEGVTFLLLLITDNMAWCWCYESPQASVPKVASEVKAPRAQAPGTAAAVAPGAAPGRPGAPAAAAPAPGSEYEAVIKARPEFASLGKLFKSCPPVR